MKFIKKIAVLTASIVIASSAQAVDLTGLYGGVSYLAEVNHDEARISGATATGDQKDEGYGAFIGYQYNDLLGVQLSYKDLGESSTTYTNSDNTTAGASTERQSASLDLLIGKEIVSNLRVFAKVGYGLMYAETSGFDYNSVNFTTAKIGEKTTEWGANYGLGAQYNYGKFFVRAEWEQLPEVGGPQCDAVTCFQSPASEPEVYSVSIGAGF